MKNRALSYTVGFALIGLIITLLISYVQRKALSVHHDNQAFVNLGYNIKHKITLANLLLEQSLAGNDKIKLDTDVLTKYTSARNILQGAYDGNQTEAGRFPKINNEDIKAGLKESMNDIDKLALAAKERFDAKQNQIVDSTMLIQSVYGSNDAEIKFDSSNKKFQATFEHLLASTNHKVQADSYFINTISWVSLFVVIVTFVLLGFGIYRLQLGNDKMQKESDERLALQEGTAEKLSGFVEAVSAGNFDVQLALDGDDTNLTSKLITMRDKLKENTESERRRGWSTMGLAQIGEILRVSTSNAAELYDSIIRFVVKYTRSNQGGLFVLNEDTDNQHHVFLDLVSCYAYERKKFLSKKVEPGEGLVGQCFLEGERIYLIDVPDEYVSIGSGLGGSKPKGLLIVPMKLNGKVYGVIELATFSKFEDFEIELIEKLAESIASTISTVRTNESTRILLETTQQQSEEMKAQEEEIRQNMEELEATQEEMRRKQTMVERELMQSQTQMDFLKGQEKKLTDSQDALQAIVDNIPRAIFWKDKDLRFMGCNKIFADNAGLASPRDIVGKTDFEMAWSDQADAYRKDDLEVMQSRKSKLNIEEANTNSEGSESWVLTSKVPIINLNDEVVAILGMFEDITARKHHEADVALKLREREQALKEIQDLKQLLQSKG